MTKWLLVLGVFLAVVLVNLNSIQALTFDCEFRSLSTCNAGSGFPNIVFKTSGATNAHGELFSGTAYTSANGGYGLCCNFNHGRPALCTSDAQGPGQVGDGYVDNRTIILSSTTNAHAESPQPSSVTYTTPVCYGNLECIQTSSPSCPPDYLIAAFSISSQNNAHIGAFNDYPLYKICCRNPTEPVPQNCGDGTIQSPEECDNSTNNGVECTPNYGSQCAYCSNSCNTVIVQGDSCGDSITQNPPEECDDGVISGNSDSCILDSGAGYSCKDAFCGDGYLWNTDGGTEQCDDSNNINGDGCSSTCQIEVCAPDTCQDIGKQCGNNWDDGCGGLINCGTCSGTNECNATGQCVPASPTCSFVSAYWSKATAVDGELVQLRVQGSSACNGLSVSFEIWEDDGILGDDTLVSLGGTNPASAIHSGGLATGNWNAQYFEDTDGINAEDEYYFKATIAGVGTENSGLGGGIGILTVSQPVIPPGQCDGIISCASYNISTCGGDICGVNNSAACGSCGAGDITYDTNCRCQWNVTVGACQDALDTFTCQQNQSGQCNNNGVQDIGEACDGNNFVNPETGLNFTCQDFSYSGGSLTCNNCQISSLSCTGHSCNPDGIVRFRNESCDPQSPANFTRFDNITGLIIGNWSCINFDEYQGGNLLCNSNCDFNISQCTFYGGGGNDGFAIGTCVYGSVLLNDCEDSPDGFYRADWTGTWAWGHAGYPDNNTCVDRNGVGCVQDPDDNLWYYDPSEKKAICEAGGTNTLECPAEIRLPFFGNLQLIITLLVIASIYGLLALDRKK